MSLAFALASTSLPAAAQVRPTQAWAIKEPKVTPADAQARRVAVQQRARSLSEAGALWEAASEYDDAALEQGDPVLFLDAAQAYFEAARQDGDVALAHRGIERAKMALDVAYFHLDSAADKDFRLVESSDVAGLIVRANELVARGEALIDELERDAASPPPPPEAKRERDTPPGRIKIVSGAALTTVGSGLLVMGVVGLGLGAARQREAQDPTVYGEEYDAVEQRGKRANVIAGVGLAVGAVVTAAGIALLVSGKKDAKRARGGDKVVHMSPMFGARAGGLTLSGRF